MASMQDAMLAQLKGIALFQAVQDHDLSDLAARATRRRLDPGKMVFKEGAAADSLYVVLSGSVKIFVHDTAGREVVLDTKKAGEYFGEMMLDHRPRSASIVTLEPSEFAVIGRDDFRAFLARHPQAAEQLILNLIRVTRGMNDRVKHYVRWLDEVKAPDLPAVKRWLVAKRWVLVGLLVLAVSQFYFMDVLLQIVSMPSLTVFFGR
jgi:signal-transduction protein with cAMP-binding, CBS, and nucleotidyltransferase domain